MRKRFWVYIMASRSKCLYVGVTSNLERRVHQHKTRYFRGHTSRYNIRHLVYYEEVPDVRSAMTRERQVKKWRRSKRVALIRGMNPGWRDLSRGWFAAPPSPG